MASKKELFKKKAQELTTIHNMPKPTALGVFNDIEKVKKSIQIFSELQDFIRPLSEEQYHQLEKNIILHGCQDALVLWETSEFDLGRGEGEQPIYVLVDGHNRFRICKTNHIDFKITLKVFASTDEVKDYMIDLQIGRRNLSIEEESYYRGLKYNSQKANRGIALQIAQKGGGEQTINVAENLAKTYNVSSRTIKNDGKFAEGLSKLSKELRSEVLQGTSKLTKKEIQKLADLTIENGTIDLTSGVKSNEDESEISMDDKKHKLIETIKKLSNNLKSKKSCDVLILKLNELKSILL